MNKYGGGQLIGRLYVKKKEKILWDPTFLWGSLLIQEMSMKKRTCPTNYKFKAMQSTSPSRKLGTIF
jgi:hypothetical protein